MRNCFKHIALDTIFAHRLRFWGRTVLNARERRDKIRDELQIAHNEYNKRCSENKLKVDSGKSPFIFMAGGKQFCEKAYVNLLGIANYEGFKTKTWNAEVKIFLGKVLFCDIL